MATDSNSRLRVLHIVPSLPYGGLQRVAIWLAAEQRQTGMDSRIAGLYDGELFRDYAEAAGIPAEMIGRASVSPQSVARLCGLLRQSWDIVHVHSGLLWSNALALLLKNQPVVFHAHNYPPADNEGFKLLAAVNGLMTDAVIAVSDDVARAWQKQFPGIPVRRVYNGIPIIATTDARIQRARNETVVFGMATRLAADKGLKEFTSVADAIHHRLPEARFAIAGCGPEESALRDDIEKRGLTPFFSLAGHIDKVEQFWNAVDIALFTAPGEAFGLRIVEPMVQGIPVVAYRTGAGSDEVLRADHTALVADYGNVEELAALAVSLAHARDRQRELAEQAYSEVADRFSVWRMSKGVSDVYQSIFKPN